MSNETKPLNIYQRLAKVSPTVPKAGKNAFHKYEYFTAEDVAEILRREFKTHGIFMIPDVTGSTLDKETGNLFVKITVSFVNIDDPKDEISIEWEGCSRDVDSKGGVMDKGLAKAVTSALKQCLLKTFLMSDGEDEDSEKGDDVEREDYGTNATAARVTLADNPERYGKTVSRVTATESTTQTPPSKPPLPPANGAPNDARPFDPVRLAKSFHKKGEEDPAPITFENGEELVALMKERLSPDMRLIQMTLSAFGGVKTAGQLRRGTWLKLKDWLRDDIEMCKEEFRLLCESYSVEAK